MLCCTTSTVNVFGSRRSQTVQYVQWLVLDTTQLSMYWPLDIVTNWGSGYHLAETRLRDGLLRAKSPWRDCVLDSSPHSFPMWHTQLTTWWDVAARCFACNGNLRLFLQVSIPRMGKAVCLRHGGSEKGARCVTIWTG